MKIDAFSHIIPPKYSKVLQKLLTPEQYQFKVGFCKPLSDLDERFGIMDEFEPLRQVLTLGWPSVEEIAEPSKASELARIVNDEMAELVLKYPDRFVAAIATLPMNNIDAALEEADRAIKDLKLRGVYLYTPIGSKPLDAPELFPIYEKMAQYDLPLFIHPMLSKTDFPDYKGENESRHWIYQTFGWPYETTKAMARLVYSGIMEKHPNLKFVTHHCGGMVPYFSDRIRRFMELIELNGSEDEKIGLTGNAIDYYQKFYNDTALYGNSKALECAADFFGVDRVLFGVDFPLGDTEYGVRNYRNTIDAIDQMDITEDERKKIYEGNAKKLLRLP